ncbi:unnamed protein product [Chironomus riparius]|uniref:Uncharacterized protein n=1 Tax=Chironomus riparius TaxID=315576 RepID=A0A9N9RM03_9DIPT|nr:unnamed protein product [Chironomus riparius]
MFKSNLLVKNVRCIIRGLKNPRCYSQKPIKTRLQEKFYVVEVKNDVTKLQETTDILIMQSSIKEVPTRVTRQHWDKLFDATYEITSIYRNQFWLKLRKIGIDDKFIDSKKQQGQELLKRTSEKTPQKLKELKAASQEQWVLIKESENFTKIKQFPSKTLTITKDMSSKKQLDTIALRPLLL